ncbi:MAG TPA: DUF6429 family protein [Chthoniobacterales bacterium]|nr:DUF6429 family protein [Chthoniobacterales bacterium]
MNPNLDKIDEAVLALLYFTSFTEGKGEFAVTRAWKSHDWKPLNPLYDRGCIFDPKNKYKSVVLTKEGQHKGEELFQRLFWD